MTKISLWGKQMIYLLCWKMKDSSNTSTFSKLHRNTCSHTVKCAQLSYPLRPCGLQPVRLLCPWDSPGKNPGVGTQATLHILHPLVLTCTKLSSVGCAEHVDQGGSSTHPAVPRAQAALDTQSVNNYHLWVAKLWAVPTFLEICSLIFLICWVEHTLLL